MSSRADPALPGADVTARPWEAWLVGLTGVAFVVAVFLKIDGANGPWYWPRPWLALEAPQVALWLAAPALVFALALACIERARGPWPVGAIGLLMLANLGFQVAALLAHGRGFAFLEAIVTSPWATSYFTDAGTIRDAGAWLAGFHQAQLQLHSSTHPPGPVLFYYAWLGIVGPTNAALVGGLSIGVLGALCIPVVYLFSGEWTRAPRARLLCCALYALVPAPIVFFPEFDQVYPVFSMLIALAWMRAVKGDRGAAIVLGLSTAAAAFFAWNLLATGAFVALHATGTLWRERGRAPAWRRIGGIAAIVAAAVTGVYGALALGVGYHPIKALLHALEIQSAHAANLDRPWLDCIALDLVDFLTGAGVLAAPLLLLFALRLRGAVVPARDSIALSLLGLATILVVDLSGLLRAETARVWIFLLPFAIVPAALELTRFSRAARAGLFAVQGLILLALVCRVSFIDA